MYSGSFDFVGFDLCSVMVVDPVDMGKVSKGISTDGMGWFVAIIISGESSITITRWEGCDVLISDSGKSWSLSRFGRLFLTDFFLFGGIFYGS